MLSNIEHIKSFDAKTHLSSLLARVQSGEQFVITKHNHAVARLVPIEPERPSVIEAIKNIREMRMGWRLDYPGGISAAKTEGRR